MSKLLLKVANTVIGLILLSGHTAWAGESDSELLCLARNIYYESGDQSWQGKVAVGMVTLNRVDDPRWPKTVCGVVKQKTVVVSEREVHTRRSVESGWGPFKQRQEVVDTRKVQDRRVVCQFSWVCAVTRRIKESDHRWQESLAVARELLGGGRVEHMDAMGDWLYFHSTRIRPGWRNLERADRIDGHVFYRDKE